MTIRFTTDEITKAIDTAKMFGAPEDNVNEILEKFEEAGKKTVELQYIWGHVAVTPDGIELQVLPGTMCKTISVMTVLAPTIHKFVGIGQMLKPIFEEFVEKIEDVGEKITDLFKTPCINAIYDYDRDGKRVTVAIRRNDVPNGTEFIVARINDGREQIGDNEVLSEIKGRKPVFADAVYSKDNELSSRAYERVLSLVRHYNRDELEAIIAENGWQSVKDIAESYKAYSIYTEVEKATNNQ